ncbi:unnamed protein product [Callosobruchus maculatus]|uniref:Uncharacterized protein n=1 Tax=Callosobruchus maculatus TaxID=64391 RepID=A0A653DDP0_CALMS|nr:unnamed protein product [Callosobruchus maculatus]
MCVAQVSDEELDSDSNETKRSLNEFIESIHSYCVSPEMLEQQNSWLRGKLAYYRRALSVAKKQVQELKLENTALKTTLGYINTEQFMPEHLEENHQNVQPSDDLKWWNVSSCK